MYLEDVDYYRERDALNRLYRDVKSVPYMQESSVQCWYNEFQDWIRLHMKHHVSMDTGTYCMKTFTTKGYTLLIMFVCNYGVD